MKVIVFAGPTISESEVISVLPDASVLPPAKQGDILKAKALKPDIILLIDGTFEQHPAVWHKEILDAIDNKVVVIGCSSMGALRATELALYGMIGVGEVFESFDSGKIEDDDEVTLLHTDKSYGYGHISEALVDIKFTLKSSVKAGIISDEVATSIEGKLKETWYPYRTYTLVFETAAQFLEEESLKLFVQFASNAPSLKKLDAFKALELIKTTTESRSVFPAAPDFDFSFTDAWQMMLDEFNVEEKAPYYSSHLLSNTAINHDGYETQILSRYLAKKLISEVSKEETLPTMHKIAQKWACSSNGQTDFNKLGKRLDSLSLTPDEFIQFIERETALDLLKAKLSDQSSFAIDEILSSGELDKLN
ncbi:TfuA-like protein [Pseudoalteromonas luteoviolacea]|uniref:TfuA-like protein n=1 Tax=Pseudoalteromonas luteoviolacea TaxID=43657 RepID=UPI001B364620|nr:TfuA-like protein [Pseudoalteromonas luteoviolacea]MBQ4836757.1 hypothetical protein [Pseudoalteromonas luteoviolacea]